MNKPVSDALLLSYLQAAELLSLSEPTLKRLVKDGAIPYVRIGRRVLFSRQSLAKWIESNEHGVKSPIE